MAQVTVTLNGRTYRLECDDGEEQQLVRLAGEVGQHAERLQARFGQVGDDRLLLMVSLMLADELAEMRKKLEKASAKLNDIIAERATANEVVESEHKELAEKISAAADRVIQINAGNRPGSRARS